MKAMLLDGSAGNDRTGERVRSALMAALRARGWDQEHVVLREKKIGNCAGDFFCWIRTPGVCNVNDDNRAIAEAVMASDLMIYLTPVTFGGYASALKRMVDHQIQNISPFFARVDGETHHQKRYPRYPDFLAVGWLEAPDPEAEAVFRHLARRNAINLFAERDVSGVALAGHSDAELRTRSHQWLDDLQAREPLRPVSLPPRGERWEGTRPVRRALLLVGSPRTRTSTSYALGSHLCQRLRARSLQTEVIHLHTVMRSPEKRAALLEAVDRADLIMLAFPLYVDSLPAPVMEGLERIVAHRRSGLRGERPLFAAIANCGFPEADQNATALAICQLFAREAGFDWAGSLALGGGGMIGGRPLAELGGRAGHLLAGLELAADALAGGRGIPDEAEALVARPLSPAWMFRLIGGYGWKQMARGYGAEQSLRRRPYAVSAAERRQTV